MHPSAPAYDMTSHTGRTNATLSHMAQTETRPTGEGINGYDYGSSALPPSPVSLSELALLKQAAGFGPEEERWLRRAGEVLIHQADQLVEHWRKLLAAQPHLAAYSRHPDGRVNSEYSESSRPRFVQWVRDVFERPLDQAWLDYQHEIGLRHTRAKKNQTDAADAPPHIRLRYLLAFSAVVMTSTRPFLAQSGAPAEEVDRMYEAWCKAVMLHVTLWSEPYVPPADW